MNTTSYEDSVYFIGTLPWFSPDSTDNHIVSTSRYTGDSQEQIETCLNCKYAECVNCAEWHTKARNTKIDIEELKSMLELKFSIPDICERFGASERAVRDARKKVNMIASGME